MSTKKKTEVAVERRIKFLSRDLPFPTDPTFREYRAVEEITGVKAGDIMTGNAGPWMLPILAMVALMRQHKDVDRDVLDKVMDLRPQDFEVTGLNLEDDDEESPDADPLDEAPKSGSKPTVETPEESGTLDSPTTSREPQESPTT